MFFVFRNRCNRLITGAALAVFPLVTFAQVEVDKEISKQATELTNLLVNYQADKGSLDRFYFLESSPERIRRMLTLTDEYSRKLEQFPYSKLSLEGKVDYTLFRRDLENARYALQQDEKAAATGMQQLPFAAAVFEVEKKRRRGAVPASAQLAKEMQDWTAQLKARLQALETDKSIDLMAGYAAEKTARDLQDALKSVHEFYNGYDPSYTWWMETAYKGVDSLLKVYGTKVLEKARKNASGGDDGSGIVGRPIGHDELVRQLKTEFIPYTPEDLVTIAEKEFAWCDQEMLKASREMGFGDDWKKAMEKVKNTYVPEGHQPEMIMDLYNQSINFLKKNDMISIPPVAEETWRMIMMTPKRQLVNPFFTGGEVLSISYPTNTMDEADKLMSMRGNNPHFSRATVHHELIAGHHLQQFTSQRNHAYRNFDTPFWTEGWALYWEILLWDKGFPRGPEDKVGMLFWRMHRCARIIFSLNYHLGKWTPQQCIDFLVNRVGHEKANAEGEVRRSFVGGYSPLYQLAYMIGGLQFNALRSELVGNGKMTLKQFNDAVMEENAMPVEMIRCILTDKAPEANFTTHWKFYPGIK
ncbi:DUF885 family protein [Flavihumibacter petaseus]|uniref:X-Pro dipeptidyl-peptidase n=1 Tax=Flavihumibacter petaseus NBRC 106054 TaxID=1220578 RepID=A0A0E9MWK3_9BACT|nr:DUF885 family protein [Flavihumibacter petaseus]GAO42127.1 hypothetical protein FPE01S_01_11400 [Flavihumibacter petaseus NBRC 106054]